MFNQTVAFLDSVILLFLSQTLLILQLLFHLNYALQLFYRVKMNQLSLLRLIMIPTLKTTNKLWQPSPERTSQLFKQFCKASYLSKIQQKIEDIEIPIYPTSLTEPVIKSQAEETTEEDEQELVQLSKSNNSCKASSKHVKKNHIDHRIKILQYQANNPSQDSCTYEQLHSIDAYTVSVFDGHGGRELAQYSKSKISKFIDSYLEDNLKSQKEQATKSIGEILKESIVWSYQKLEDTFFEIYEEQIKIGNKKIKNVGTCGITAIVHNDRVYVGNSGDSQGIFVLKDGINMFRSLKANNRLSANNRLERERLRKQWEGRDENIIQEQYNNCFYLKGRLQPTRTIGDYYLKKKDYYSGDGLFAGPYLNCIPDINEHQITKSHKYMVIASDGLWDVLSKEEVTQSLLLQKEIDLNKTCYDMDESEQAPYLHSVLHNVLNRACEMSGRSMEELKKMQRGIRRNYHDDITIAVINLQNQCNQ